MKKRFLLIAAFVCALPLFANAQFNSGSTGADGALDLLTMTCPNNICEVQLPESGILNYTTVNIPSGKLLRFKFNSRNTPVIVLAQGNITISGTISVDADGTIAGTGGFYGGTGNSQNGFGPGGGTSSAGNGRWVGSISLVPIVGGSGGASGGGNYPGGGGGGAIVLASSANISLAPNSVLSASGAANCYYGCQEVRAVQYVLLQIT